MKTKNRGFTLIEILVVLVLVGTLLALLLPQIGKAIQLASMTRDVNNAKQVNTACQMYADDHNGELPSSLSIDTLGSYIDDTRVLTCAEGAFFTTWNGAPTSLLPGSTTIGEEAVIGAASENIVFFMSKTSKTDPRDITLEHDADKTTYLGYCIIGRLDGVAEAITEEELYAMTLDTGPGGDMPAEP